MANATTPVIQINEGKVGIGTIEPNSKLHVFGGSADVELKVTTNDNFISRLGLYEEKPGNLHGGFIQYRGESGDRLEIGSRNSGTDTVHMTIDDSTGNVGIGTDNPRGKLDVVGNTDTDSDFLTIQDDDTSAGSHRPSIRFRSNTAQIGQILGLNGRMRFSSGTSESSMIEILDNGNVGIGTTDPLHDLQIGTAGTNGRYSMMMEGNFSSDAVASNPRLNLIDTNFGITAGKYNSATSRDALGIFGYQGAGRGIVFAHTTAGFSTALINMRQDMFIDGGTGFVGINTVSPTGLLNVEGNATGDNTPQIIISSGGVDNNAILQFNDDDGGQTCAVGALEGNLLTLASEGDFLIKTGTGSITGNTSIRLFIDQSGNVGIGYAIPQSKLHVSSGSSIETTLIIGASGTGSNKSSKLFFNEGEDNVSNSKDYGFSLAYDGEGSQYPGLAANEFGIIRHNNSANGVIVMKMARTNNNTTFTGTVTATNFILSSDERLKENIKTLKPKKIDIKWKSFNLKTDNNYRTGVIAQELETEHPEFVRTDKEGLKSVAYIDLLIAKIAELEARLEKLEK